MSILTLEHTEFISTITLNRPEQRHAINHDLLRMLNDALDEVTRKSDIRAVIFTGTGEQAFCAGADLKERQGMSNEEAGRFVDLIQSTMQRVGDLPMPTIAAINGNAFGGGLELALACDLRVARKDALVGLTECGLGIIPGAGGTQRLPRIIGLARALELIFTARRITIDEACELGLVNASGPNADKTRMLAVGLAQEIARNAPLAIRAAKTAITSSLDCSLKEGLKIERASYQRILGSTDRKEGIQAFLEKRAPLYRGN